MGGSASCKPQGGVHTTLQPLTRPYSPQTQNHKPTLPQVKPISSHGEGNIGGETSLEKATYIAHAPEHVELVLGWRNGRGAGRQPSTKEAAREGDSKAEQGGEGATTWHEGRMP